MLPVAGQTRLFIARKGKRMEGLESECTKIARFAAIAFACQRAPEQGLAIYL